MIIWLSIAAGLGVISAVVARAKGLPPIRWGLAGILLGIVVVPYLLLSSGRGYAKDWRPLRFGLPGREAACPHCGAKVDADAVVCRQCRQFLGGGFGLPEVDPEEDESSAEADGEEAAARPAPAQRAAAARRSEATAKEPPKTRHNNKEKGKIKETAKDAPSGMRIDEEALRNPMFRRLDDAFARMSGESRPPEPRETAQRTSWPDREERSATGRQAAAAPPPPPAAPAAAEQPPPATPVSQTATAPDAPSATAQRPAPAPKKTPSATPSAPEIDGAEVERAATPAEPPAPAAEETAPDPVRPTIAAGNGKRTFDNAFGIKPTEDQRLAFPPTDHLLLRKTRSAPGSTAPVADRQPATPTTDDDEERRMPTLDTRPPTLRAVDEPVDERRRLPGAELRAIPPITRIEPPAARRRRGSGRREGRPPTNRPPRRRAPLAVALGAVAVATVLFAAYTTPNSRAPWASLLSPPPVPMEPAGSEAEPIIDRPLPETADAGSAVEVPGIVPEDPPEVASASPREPLVPAPPGPPSATPPSVPPPPSSAAAGSPDGAKSSATASRAVPPTVAPSKPPASPTAPGRQAAAASRKEASRPAVEEDFASIVRRALEERRDRSATYRQLDADAANGISATGETVTLVQQRLQERGYDPGRVDGLGGPRTRAAIRAFQRDNELAVDGKIDMELLQQLGLVGKRIQVFQSGSGPSLTP